MPRSLPIVDIGSKWLKAAAGPLMALALLAAAAPAHSAEFTDSAGRRVMLPDTVFHVLPAERNAEVLVLVLAPDKLAGLGRVPWRNALPDAGHLPVIGWQRYATPASVAAAARQHHADLIIDAGPVTPARAAFADAAQRQSGIPYILVDDSFARMPQMLRAIGAVLGVGGRAADLSAYAEHAIAGLHGRLLIKSPDSRPRVYFGLGANGMTAPLPGSPAGAAIDEAGAINVAGALGRGVETIITPAQLLSWNPDVVIAENRSFYDSLRRNRGWADLAAVREGHVYLEPTRPFGWIEDPSGVNRVIGLHWLSVLLYPGATEEDLRTTVCEFYDKFYRIKLTNGAIEALVRPAGIPPLEPPKPVGEPLVGLAPVQPPGHRARPGAPPSVPTLPNVPGLSGTAGGIPGLPSTAPSAKCAVPTGPSPQPLTGIITGHPQAAPGVPGTLGLPSTGGNPGNAGLSPLLTTPTAPSNPASVPGALSPGEAAAPGGGREVTGPAGIGMHRAK